MIILHLILLLLAGFFKAKMDYLQFSEIDSWRNKYKNGDPKQGEKFKFSTTFLVFLTDRWHLVQSLFLACLFLLVVTYEVRYNIICDYILLRLIFGLSFRYFYVKFKSRI